MSIFLAISGEIKKIDTCIRHVKINFNMNIVTMILRLLHRVMFQTKPIQMIFMKKYKSGKCPLTNSPIAVFSSALGSYGFNLTGYFYLRRLQFFRFFPPQLNHMSWEALRSRQRRNDSWDGTTLNAATDRCLCFTLVVSSLVELNTQLGKIPYLTHRFPHRLKPQASMKSMSMSCLPQG